MSSAKDTISETKRAAHEGVDEAAGMTQKIREKASDIGEGIRHGYEEAIEGAKHLESKFEDVVKDRPMVSLLAAAGISAAIGLCLGLYLARD